MSWWKPSTWGQPSPVALAAAPPAAPDLSGFDRSTWGPGLGASDIVHLASYGIGCRPDTPPDQVPLAVLDAMGAHPAVFASESVVTGPATDPELYFLRGDPRACAEVEAWLRPLTLGRASLLAQIARAFAYGSVPIVLDWRVADLDARVGDRVLTLPAHAHYHRAHEVHPGDAQLRVSGDRLLGVVHGGAEYGGEDLDAPGARRAFLAIWDPSFGRWTGQSSRRRAFRDWFEEGLSRLWEIRYTERSVDLPRIGFAPEGKLKINGNDVTAASLLRAQIMSLRNGSVITLPSTKDAQGNPAWGVDVLDAPDRHGIFKHVIDSRGARIFAAALNPRGGGEEQLMDSIQRVCDFTAATLTRIVNTPLALRYGPDAPFVQVLANDIPKRKLRLVQQVFANSARAVQHLRDGRTYTLAELVDPEILDQLGVKARPVESAAHAPAPAAPPTPGTRRPGRPIDVGSAREERRDAARTVEGEHDTGGRNVERDERLTAYRAALARLAEMEGLNAA